MKKVGVNWRLYDVKELQETYNKVPGIKDFKRISIKKFPLKNNQFTVKYKGSAFFRYEDISNSYGTLLKKSQTKRNIKVEEKFGKFYFKRKEKKVRTLLEKQFNHVELQWETLSQLDFFQKKLEEIVTEETAAEEAAAEEAAQEMKDCDCLEADHALHI